MNVADLLNALRSTLREMDDEATALDEGTGLGSGDEEEDRVRAETLRECAARIRQEVAEATGYEGVV